MTTYNTGNPIGLSGSADPRDLYDNAENLDNGLIGSGSEFQGRLGKSLITYRSLEIAAESLGESVAVAEQAEILAQESSILAQSLAGFLGEWSGLSGAVNRPASVYRDGDVWILESDLSAIETSEPSDSNPDWQKYTTGAQPVLGELMLMPSGSGTDADTFSPLVPADGLTYSGTEYPELTELLGRDFFPQISGTYNPTENDPISGKAVAQDTSSIYLAVNENGGGHIYVLNRTTMQLVDSINVGELFGTTQVQTVDVDDDFIYVGVVKDNQDLINQGRSLCIINKSDYTLAPDPDFGGRSVDEIIATDDYLILGTDRVGLRVINQSDFSVYFSTYGPDGDDGVSDMALDGNFIYVAFSTGLSIIDLSVPEVTQEILAVGVVSAVTYDNNSIYFCDNDITPEGFRRNFIREVSKADYSNIINHDFLQKTSNIKDMVIDADYIYAGGEAILGTPNSTFNPQVAFIDRATKKEIFGSINSSTLTNSEKVEGLLVSDDRLLLALGGSGASIYFAALSIGINANPNADVVTLPNKTADDSRYTWYVLAENE